MAAPYDICIRGAGIVGRTLALLLARDRLRVGLVETPDPAAAADVRAYALNTASHALLSQLRAWPDDTTDAVSAVARIAERVDRGIAFTFAPWNPLLGVMHAAGRAFPRANRAPSIVPVAERALWKALDEHPDLRDWSRGRSERIKSGFYTSQACELRHR